MGQRRIDAYDPVQRSTVPPLFPDKLVAYISLLIGPSFLHFYDGQREDHDPPDPRGKVRHVYGAVNQRNGTLRKRLRSSLQCSPFGIWSG